MRKYLAATALGALLIAGQVAAQDNAVVSLGDRLGSSSASVDSLFSCNEDSNGHDRCGGWWVAFSAAAFVTLLAWGFTQSGNGKPATP